MTLIWTRGALRLVVRAMRVEGVDCTIMYIGLFSLLKLGFVVTPKRGFIRQPQTSNFNSKPNLFWASEKSINEEEEVYMTSAHGDIWSYNPETQEFRIVHHVSEYCSKVI